MNSEEPLPQRSSPDTQEILTTLQRLHPVIYLDTEVNRRALLAKQTSVSGLLHRVDAADLRRRSQRTEHWLKDFADWADRQKQEFHPAEHVLGISDADGVILHSAGSAAWRAIAGILPGYDWSESQMGPSGIGTALTERRPVLINGMQRYDGDPVLALGVPILKAGATLGALELRIRTSDAKLEQLKTILEIANSAR